MSPGSSRAVRSASARSTTAAGTINQIARGRASFFTNSSSVLAGTFGPDLTHLGSRATIAAGLLPNRRGHLAGWIVDSESLKRNSGMPMNAMEPRRLQWLLDFLQELR